jgi:hypothetical protein
MLFYSTHIVISRQSIRRALRVSSPSSDGAGVKEIPKEKFSELLGEIAFPTRVLNSEGDLGPPKLKPLDRALIYVDSYNSEDGAARCWPWPENMRDFHHNVVLGFTPDTNGPEYLLELEPASPVTVHMLTADEVSDMVVMVSLMHKSLYAQDAKAADALISTEAFQEPKLKEIGRWILAWNGYYASAAALQGQLLTIPFALRPTEMSYAGMVWTSITDYSLYVSRDIFGLMTRALEGTEGGTSFRGSDLN